MVGSQFLHNVFRVEYILMYTDYVRYFIYKGYSTAYHVKKQAAYRNIFFGFYR